MGKIEKEGDIQDLFSPYQEIGPRKDESLQGKINELNSKTANNIEDQLLDFKEFPLKEIKNFVKEIAKDIIAFASTFGGNIIIGVRDKSSGIDPSLIGIPQQKFSMIDFERQIKDNIQPPYPKFEIKEKFIHDKRLWFINIHSGEFKYILSDGKMVLRGKSNNIPFNDRYWERIQVIKNPKNRAKLLLDEFNFEDIKEYLNKKSKNEDETKIDKEYLKEIIKSYNSFEFDKLKSHLIKTGKPGLSALLELWEDNHSKIDSDFELLLIYEDLMKLFDSHGQTIKNFILNILKSPTNRQFTGSIRYAIISENAEFENTLKYLLNKKIDDYCRLEVIKFLLNTKNSELRMELYVYIEKITNITLLEQIIPEINPDTNDKVIILIEKFLVHEDKRIRIKTLDILSNSKRLIKYPLINGSIFDIEKEVTSKALEIILSESSSNSTYMKESIINILYEDNFISNIRNIVNNLLEKLDQENLIQLLQERVDFLVSEVEWPRETTLDDYDEIYYQLFSNYQDLEYQSKTIIIEALNYPMKDLLKKIGEARDKISRKISKNVIENSYDTIELILSNVSIDQVNFTLSLCIDLNNREINQLGLVDTEEIIDDYEKVYPQTGITLICLIKKQSNLLKIEISTFFNEKCFAKPINLNLDQIENINQEIIIQLLKQLEIT